MFTLQKFDNRFSTKERASEFGSENIVTTGLWVGKLKFELIFNIIFELPQLLNFNPHYFEKTL